MNTKTALYIPMVFSKILCLFLFMYEVQVDARDAGRLTVFVYGTLKKGEPNQKWLTPGNGTSKFLGVGKTVEKFPLVIASKFNIPFLLDAPGTGNNIEGEIYEIDKKMLSKLDMLEGYPSYYDRRLEKIAVADGTEISSWIYILKGFKPTLLKQPYLTSYSSRGEHGKSFIEPYKTDLTRSSALDEVKMDKP